VNYTRGEDASLTRVPKGYDADNLAAEISEVEKVFGDEAID
jgi:hypothetical protein